MLRKMLLAMVATGGVMMSIGAVADAGHGHGHGGHRGHYHGGYRGGYRGGYGGGVVIAPRVIAPPVYSVPAPVYGYPSYPVYGTPYGYGYQPYNSALGIQSGNFSLFLGR